MSLTLIKKLRLQVQQNSEHVLFLGAGASVDSGGRTGPQIAREILAKFYGAAPDNALLERFRAEHDRNATFDDVVPVFATGPAEQRRLLQAHFAKMAPSNGYALLAALLRAGYFNSIVLSVNFEPMLEAALTTSVLGDRRTKFRTVTGDALSDKIALAEDEVVIVKLHGDLNEPDTLRISDRDTSVLPPPCLDLVKGLSTHGFVMLGYSAGDRDIQSAMSACPKSKNGHYLITKGSIDLRHDRTVGNWLAQSESLANVMFDITFDDFMVGFAGAFPQSLNRRKHRVKLDGLWRQLDYARTHGKDRSRNLSKLDKQVTSLLLSLDLSELRALQEFARYEIDRSGATYRLQQGTEFLRDAIEACDWLESGERFPIELAFATQLLNVFLTGEHVPGGRSRFLEQAVTESERLHREVPKSDLLLKARAALVLAEALKEKAMVTHNPVQNRELTLQCRELCHSVIKDLANRSDNESKYLLGVAYRHGAVTFELEADLDRVDDRRRSNYQTWNQWSEAADQHLLAVGEDSTRGYALLNLGSSLTRLASFEHNPARKRAALADGLEKLKSAEECLTRVHDLRGLGWVSIHMAANLRNSINLQIGDSEKAHLYGQLESTANRAIATLRPVGDQLALGLAFMELGIALLLVYQRAGANTRLERIKLTRAIAALSQSTQLLANEGYFRAVGEAFWWLSKCHLADFATTGSASDLTKSVNALVNGLTATAAAIGEMNTLSDINSYLTDELGKML